MFLPPSLYHFTFDLIIALEFYSQLFLLIVVSLFAVRSAKFLYVVLKGCFPQVFFRVQGLLSLKTIPSV